MAEETQADSVLDPAAMENLRELVSGNVKALTNLIDVFLEEAPQLLADMRQAVENGDATALHLAAHSLKSNSAEFGATTLSALCRELEMMAKAGTLDGVAKKLAQAESESKKVKTALRAARCAL